MLLTSLILILFVVSLYTKNPLLGGVLIALYLFFKLRGFLRGFRRGGSTQGEFLSRLFFGSRNDGTSNSLSSDLVTALLAAVNPDKLQVEYPRREAMPDGKDDPLGGLFRE